MQIQLISTLALVMVVVFRLSAVPIAPVSGDDFPSATGSGGSFLPVFSESGGAVVFLSHANNLVTNDDLALTLNVFLADVDGAGIELISVGPTGRGGADADILHVSVSRYADFIAFSSYASNLATNDVNNAADIFLRRTLTRETSLVSTDQSGGSPVDPAELLTYMARPLSGRPSIASVAGAVVFESVATNLASLTSIVDANGANDVFVRDGQWIELVSRAYGTTETGNGASHSPQISRLGDSVAFISTATNLISGGVTNSGGDIYLYRSGSGVVWMSPGTRALLIGPPTVPLSPSATYYCFDYALSGDGNAVVYQANAGPGTSNVLLYCALGWTSAIRIAADSDPVGRPQISQGGDWVAFSSRSNIYLWNRTTGSNTLISANTNGLPGNGPSHSPVMSSDPNASLIAFVSKATDLGPEGTSFQIFAFDRWSGSGLRLVSVNTNGAASSGDFELSNIAVSTEGSPPLIAFDSTAADLVTNDLNGASDVFVRNIGASRVRLISRRLDTLPARTTVPMSGASPNSVSADGRVVAFTSLDNPLVPDDTNRWQDVFVQDLISNRIERVSGTISPPLYLVQVALKPAISAAGTHVAYEVAWTASGGGGNPTTFWTDLSASSNALVSTTTGGAVPSQGRSHSASVSFDGRLVMFESTVPASTFSTNYSDVNGTADDIFLRDMSSGEMRLVSVNSAGTSSGNGPSTNALMSPDGRWVVFTSTATDLTEVNVTSGLPSLFGRDLGSNRTEVVSVGPDGNAQWGSRGRPAFSGNSRYVAFVGDNYPIVRRDLETKTSAMVCAQGERPSLSWDGRFVAYEKWGPPQQIYLAEMESRLAKLVSANLAGTNGNGNSTAPQISANGRFIVFQSAASDLVENDRNNAPDIFVADRITGSIVLLTMNKDGTGSAAGASSKAILSADGRVVVFQSLAPDLITGDYNDRRDVFYARLAMPDSDGDGMDDDFEVTYFGDLTRDGAGDRDGDGHSDGTEFVAGTNPASDTSILKVITVGVGGGAARQVVWSSVVGRTYAVQYKDALNDGWSTLAGTVRAAASTAARVDGNSAASRFYRVVLVE